MKIKLDENLPDEVVELLRSAQHDVHTVRDESLVGAEDDVVFQAACREQRLLMTQDLDFSDVRRFRPGTHPGIVLIRIQQPSRSRLVARIRETLRHHSIESWAGCFVVLGEIKIRIQRP